MKLITLLMATTMILLVLGIVSGWHYYVKYVEGSPEYDGDNDKLSDKSKNNCLDARPINIFIFPQSPPSYV